jgi:hypothetical protein
MKKESDFAIDDDTESELLLRLHQRFAKRCVDYTFGRNRGVFVMPGNYVVKIPKNGDGCTDNDWEGSISNGEDSSEEDVQYARTRLFYYKEDNNLIPIVFMEYVEYHCDYKNQPDWVASVDCGQVGYNKKGRLVAFDYGIR